jgi:hypothetical protein
MLTVSQNGVRLLVITVLISTPFWTKKVKIAILTLATFAALC